MKRIYNMLLTVVMLSVLASCGDFMDVHKDYIKGGEIIYAPKIDSMVFIAGEYRIQFRYWLYKSPNVRSVDLYWNDGADSLIIPVTPTAGIDSLTTVIPNLEERSYTFTARTTDSYGHKSLYMTEFGTAYGELYQNLLSNRRINTLSIEEYDNQPSGMISLFSAGAGLVRTEFRYQKTDGTTKIVTAAASKNSLVCPFAKPGSTFDIRSLYIPETESIDTFATAWVTYTAVFPDVDIYRYDRSSWEVVDVSDERADDGGGRNTLLDNDLGSYWHSQWGPDVDLPHWAIIDMKVPKNIVKFDMYRRPGNTDTKTVECYLGDTPDPDGEWTKIGEGEYPNSRQDLIEIETTDKITTGRYLKLVVPDSYRAPYTNIAEVYPYGGF